MKQSIACSVGVLLAAFTIRLPAQPPGIDTITARLNKLEHQVDALQEENRALRQQLGISSPHAPAHVILSPGKEQRLSLGGYIHINGGFGDAPDARFPAADRVYVRKARLTLKGDLSDDFALGLQTEFGNSSTTGKTDSRGQLTDCFVTWKRYAIANITVGQFKTPYGYDQLGSDTSTPLIERPLPSDKLTLSRQIGAMVSGKVLDGRLTYAAGLYNGNKVNNGSNDNNQFLYVGRVAGTLARYAGGKVTAGLDGFTTRDTGSFTGKRDGNGMDLQVTEGPAELTAEYLHIHFGPDAAAGYDANGWSILGGLMIIPQKLQGLVRYETYDAKEEAAGNTSDLWTIGCNYFVKGDDIKLSLNYLIGNPAGPAAEQQRILGRLQVIF